MTANTDGRDNGCISNTFQQVTSSPNQVSICLNKDSLTCEMIAKSGIFTVSIICEAAEFGLFRHFGFQSGRQADKFKDYNKCIRVENGTMAVTAGTNSFISVKVSQSIDLGTHTMYIGEVTEMKSFNEIPPATYNYYQEFIKPKPNPSASTGEKRTVWRCKVCGYIYDGEELPPDFICPICKHPASDFEKVEI